MKRAGNLFPLICSYANAEDAYFRASACKHTRYDFLILEMNRGGYLAQLCHDIATQQYMIGNYTSFTVFEPKRRDILKLPAIDRVAQHMWNTVITNVIEPRFFEHSYACRPGMGLHLASNTLHSWLYSEVVVQGKKIWAIKGDLSSYFKSINHQILKNKMREYIKDEKALWLTDIFIDNNGPLPEGVGIPVGNLSSQIFANVYGTILDIFVKHVLHCKYYMRYMDDFIILGDNYHILEAIMVEISQFVQANMLMQLNPSSTIVYAQNGIDFIGFVHYPTHTIPRNISTKRLKRFVELFINGTISEDQFMASFTSRVGHLEHCDCKRDLLRIFQELQKVYGTAFVTQIPWYKKIMLKMGQEPLETQKDKKPFIPSPEPVYSYLYDEEAMRMEDELISIEMAIGEENADKALELLSAKMKEQSNNQLMKEV